jgi:hypothetical protein
MPRYPPNHYIKSQTKRNREQRNNPRHLDETLPGSCDGHWSFVPSFLTLLVTRQE